VLAELAQIFPLGLVNPLVLPIWVVAVVAETLLELFMLVAQVAVEETPLELVSQTVVQTLVVAVAVAQIQIAVLAVLVLFM
jgi:hypothetical protein